MRKNVKAIAKTIAFSVPALMFLSGVIMLLSGFLINHSEVVTGGLILILIGINMHILKSILEFIKDQGELKEEEKV